MKPLVVLFALVAVGFIATPVPAQAAPVSSTDWLCHPGLDDDPCEIGLDTTYQAADGTAVVEAPDRLPQDERPVDCFYVYPTVSNQLTPNATATAAPEVVSIAKYQASRYSSICRVYAPLYRQASVPGLVLGPLGTAKVAYRDVLAAWNDYLANDNDGRGVVLIGHSQGTMLLRKLIQEEIDDNPEVRDRLVGAMLLGGNVTVKKGSTLGGDFQNIPACTEQGQIGCVVAYSSYVTDPLPLSFFGVAALDMGSLAFGVPATRGGQVLCTDPGVLSGDSNDFGITIPSEPFAPGVIQSSISLSVYGQVPTADTTWVSPADRYQGSCRTINGVTVFKFAPVDSMSRQPLEVPPLWGTHIFDANLGLEKLVSIVQQQTATYLATH